MQRPLKFRAWRGDRMETVTDLRLRDDGSVDWGVLPGVIMQSTNLKDKDGKEIYEGDIVQSQGIDKTFVENVPDLLRLGHLLGEHMFVPDKCKIIGNIYENPELLTANV